MKEDFETEGFEKNLSASTIVAPFV